MSDRAGTSTAVTSTAATLSVDWTRCDGHGLCAALLPDSIGLDDWGYPLLHQRALATERAGDVRRAVGACPALALRLGA